MAGDGTGDVLGHRCKLGVLIPATNTIVQPELDRMRPLGVTNHIARIRNPDMPITSDADFVRLVELLAKELDAAADTLLACAPDGLLLGVTALSVWGGRLASETRLAALETRAGVPVTGGAEALADGIAALGLRRVGLLSPYQPVLDTQVIRFLAEGGVEVVTCRGLRCASPLAIAAVRPDQLRAEIRAHDSDRIEAWVQVGTNLAMAGLVAPLEAELGKPVLAVNPVSYRRALRRAGIDDPIPGHGRLLAGA
jgi:maleate isomerase